MDNATMPSNDFQQPTPNREGWQPRSQFDNHSQPSHSSRSPQHPWTAPASVIEQPEFKSETQPDSSLSTPDNSMPIPVVKVLSVHGIEYAMMTIALWFTAFTIIWALINLLYSGASYDMLIAPISGLIVSLPIFGILFLRLRKAELADSNLRKDPSKRRWSQMTQILAFLTCLINLVVFAYVVLAKISGNSKESIGKTIGSLAIVLVVAGGILAFYWFDEHRTMKDGR